MGYCIRICLLFLSLVVEVKAQFNLDSLKLYRSRYILETKGRFPDQKQDFYEFNAKFNMAANYKTPRKPKTISIPTSGVKIKDYSEFAIIKFLVDGEEYMITAYRPSPIIPLYKNLVFILFKDLSSPLETYGGGRYMDMDIKDFNGGKVIIDFNKAYNPYCAFSDGWNCPIPPLGNHLKAKIEAGEKKPLTAH